MVWKMDVAQQSQGCINCYQLRCLTQKAKAQNVKDFQMSPHLLYGPQIYCLCFRLHWNKGTGACLGPVFVIYHFLLVRMNILNSDQMSIGAALPEEFMKYKQ